jgi:enoyl-CoA hydratase/carnithine racemase
MQYEDILYEVDGHAAVITLNRPTRLNAWTGNMARDYRDALARADADRQVRGVILTGAGRGFCAGADMGFLNSVADTGGMARAESVKARPGAMDANYNQPFSFPLATKKPLIAAVNGPAAGLGLIHALYCDMRFASENARFGTAFAAIGLIAEHGISWLLPRIVGTGKALDLLYSARVIGAEEALSIGLVDRVYPHDELLPKAKEYVEYLAAHSSPEAMAAMKRLVYDAQFTDIAAATSAATDVMHVTLGGADFKEGLSAFSEKRLPNYRGVGEG